MWEAVLISADDSAVVVSDTEVSLVTASAVVVVVVVSSVVVSLLFSDSVVTAVVVVVGSAAGAACSFTQPAAMSERQRAINNITVFFIFFFPRNNYSIYLRILFRLRHCITVTASGNYPPTAVLRHFFREKFICACVVFALIMLLYGYPGKGRERCRSRAGGVRSYE